MAICKNQIQNADATKRKTLNEQLQQLKKSLDGSYTELKRAKDALTKATKTQERHIESSLKKTKIINCS